MLRSASFALLVAGISAGPPRTGATRNVVERDTLGRFPIVESSNLEGERFALPAGFTGEMNVVLVAFKREQQSDVDSWMPFLQSVATTRHDLSIYEIPVLGRRYRLMRPFIDGGMRRGIPDAAVRAATITLYIDKAPFREALQLPDEDRIYVLLVDKLGRVHSRTHGRFDEQAGAELVRRIAETTQKPGVGG